MLLRSRLVLPITAPPIENGAVAISGEWIVVVGKWNDLQHGAHGEVVDLGDSILLPGFINAHCHLDYTDMAGLLPRPKVFSDWIKSIVELKAEWSYTDFALSWLNGARMLLESGVTTVVDFEAVPELLPEVWDSTPLRVISCLELISIRNPHSVASVLCETTARAKDRGNLKTLGIAPHSPYTTSRDVRREATHLRAS
jgi:cytosine/adenosine deaminase-related metal-dependent hydrolase